MKRVMVTGAAGLLGSNLLQVLKLRHEPLGTYHRAAYKPAGIAMMHADLTRQDDVEAAFSRLTPDVVIHCAAETRVDWSEDHPAETVKLNVDGTRHVSDAARKAGTKVVYVSTDSVFDGRRGHYREDEPTGPVNLYSRSKLDGERIALTAPRSIVIRSNLYGWNAQSKHSLAEWALSRIERGERIHGFTDVISSPILVNDLSLVLQDAVEKDLTGVFHAGSKDPLSKFEFCRMVAQEAGIDPKLVAPGLLSEAQFRAPRPRDTSLATAKIEAAIGRPMPTVREGVKRFIELRDNGYLEILRRGVPRMPPNRTTPTAAR